MTITAAELQERLARADRARLELRRATRELMEMGAWIRQRRKEHLAKPRRPDQPGSADG